MKLWKIKFRMKYAGTHMHGTTPFRVGTDQLLYVIVPAPDDQYIEGPGGLALCTPAGKSWFNARSYELDFWGVSESLDARLAAEHADLAPADSVAVPGAIPAAALEVTSPSPSLLQQPELPVHSPLAVTAPPSASKPAGLAGDVFAGLPSRVASVEILPDGTVEVPRETPPGRAALTASEPAQPAAEAGESAGAAAAPTAPAAGAQQPSSNGSWADNLPAVMALDEWMTVTDIATGISKITGKQIPYATIYSHLRKRTGQGFEQDPSKGYRRVASRNDPQ